MGRPSRRALVALGWSLALVVTTVALVAARPYLTPGHISLALLLIVLGGSAAGGRTLGFALALASFLIFNWLFLPPYGTFVVRNPLDWLVLAAFLITSLVAAQLLYRAQQEARVARERAEELNRLARLGAETLSAGRAEEAIGAIAEVIRDTTDISSCELFLRHEEDENLTLTGRAAQPGAGDSAPRSDVSLIAWVAASGLAAAERRDGTVRLHGARPGTAELRSLFDNDVLALILPLQARGRTVGVLRIARSDGLRLDEARWRFLDAISYYAALAAERVRLEADAEHAEALREADRLKDALLASVSHDLRTPLTTIKALAHDLGTLGDERAEIIEQEADRLSRTVADLLDLSRLNAGMIAVHAELNAVDDLLGALVQRIEPSLGGRPLVVTLQPDESLMVGHFDLVHAVRILANLVENAAKYAPGTSPIEVAASHEGSEVVIRVSDRGPGVPPAEAERIFEPFYRPRHAIPDASGAGLGLAIARRLARAQGGWLAYALREGGGSVFTLSLPAGGAPAPALPARSS